MIYINFIDKIAIDADIYNTDIVMSRLFQKSFKCRYNPIMDYVFCLLIFMSS